MTLAGSNLPTFSRLGIKPPHDIDVSAIGKAWLNQLTAFVSKKDIHGIVYACLFEEPWWRDLFALTWDTRTFQGLEAIDQFLRDRLDLSNLIFSSAVLQTPLVDIAWIAVTYAFETSVATGSGVARLVYTKDGTWRAVTVSTQLEGLKGFPELAGSLRDFGTSHGNWAQERQSEIEFPNGDPEVLILGAGQGGLEVAARLKHLGVTNLVIERNARVGDNWRKRYESLTLHDPICTFSLLLSLVHVDPNHFLTGQDHMPYLP